MEKLPPSKAVRKLCLFCMNGSQDEVRLCPSIDCPLYKYRLGKGEGRVRIKTIRMNCHHCTGWEIKAGKLDPGYKRKSEAKRGARNCTEKECSFYPYRPGTKPYVKKRRGNASTLENFWSNFPATSHDSAP